MTSNQVNVASRREKVQEQVVEPPMRLIVGVMALGMIVGALLGGGSDASDYTEAAPAAMQIVDTD